MAMATDNVNPLIPPPFFAVGWVLTAGLCNGVTKLARKRQRR
jgi:hypothetical protein